MIAEAMQFLRSQFKDAQHVELVQHEDLPGKIILRKPNGEIETIACEPPTRAHKLAGFDDLVAFLSDTDRARSPEVFVDGTAIRAHLDAAERRAMVHAPLCRSERWLRALDLRQPHSFEPRDLVKLLRFEFHATNVDHVIQAVRRIDFTRTNAGKTDVSHGKESLGRSVEAAVQQADGVPEQFTVTVPVWTNPGFDRYSVQLEFGLYLDMEAQKIQLRLLADEADRCLGLAMRSAADDLRTAIGSNRPDVPVYLGAA